jgi:HK97 family phage prohead protease
MSRETRAISKRPELRSAGENGGEGSTGVGYAILFNNVTNIGDMFHEQIAPGAFTASLANDDILALHSHDISRVVGRTGAGTLTLREDATGIAFENPLPDTTDGRDLAVSIERGDIPGMSFGFDSLVEMWDESVTPPMRTILEAKLYEITYTAMPAYTDTSVALRSLEAAREEARAREATEAPAYNPAPLARRVNFDLRARRI